MWKNFLNDKIINGVLGRVFESTSFSLTTIGVLASAGVIGTVAAAVLPYMWGGIAVYVASELGKKALDAHYGNGRSEEDAAKKKSAKKS